MTQRQRVLQALDGADTFVALVTPGSDTYESIDWSTVVEGLPSKSHNELWGKVNRLTSPAVTTLLTVDAADWATNDKAQQSLAVLRAVVGLVLAWVADATRPNPDSLTVTVLTLHNALFTLTGVDLQDMISKVCETWWAQQRPGREGVITQLLPILLVKSLCDGGSASDVKRVINLREALTLLDFEDESSDSLKELLLRCYVHPLYLKTSEGRKFLASLYSLHHTFLRDIHATMRAQLPCPKHMASAYGAVLLQAWKLAATNTAVLTVIEQECIQDLIHGTVHAARPATFASGRAVLEAFSQDKATTEVEEMLTRLYSPILWRALTAANGAVRRNAAALLVDVFPLQTPSALRQENEELLNKQLDMLRALLLDPVPCVRVVAVHGVCRILGVFWEMLPAASSHGFLKMLVTELAHDAAAPLVRAAVPEGLLFVLDTPLTHEALGRCLPALSSLINDKSDRVRAATVKLLQGVSKLRTIEFFQVVDKDALIARLTADADVPAVASALTQLLLPAVVPKGVTGADLLKRIAHFLRDHKDAGAAFFKLAPQYMEVMTATKLVCLLLKGTQSAIFRSVGDEEAAGKKRRRGQLTATQAQAVLSSKAANAIAALVCAASSMMQALLPIIGDQSCTEAQAAIAETWTADLADTLTSLFVDSIGTEHALPTATSAVLSLLHQVPIRPVKHTATLAWGMLSKLQPSHVPAVLPAAVSCICGAGTSDADRLWDTCISSLQAGYSMQVATASLHPVIAALVIEHLIQTDVHAAWTNLQADATRTATLLTALNQSTTLLESIVSSDDVNASLVAEAAVIALRALCKCVIHLQGLSMVDDAATKPSVPSALVNLMRWVSDTAMPALSIADLDAAPAAATAATGAAAPVQSPPRRKARGGKAAKAVVAPIVITPVANLNPAVHLHHAVTVVVAAMADAVALWGDVPEVHSMLQRCYRGDVVSVLSTTLPEMPVLPAHANDVEADENEDGALGKSKRSSKAGAKPKAEKQAHVLLLAEQVCRLACLLDKASGRMELAPAAWSAVCGPASDVAAKTLSSVLNMSSHDKHKRQASVEEITSQLSTMQVLGDLTPDNHWQCPATESLRDSTRNALSGMMKTPTVAKTFLSCMSQSASPALACKMIGAALATMPRTAKHLEVADSVLATMELNTALACVLPAIQDMRHWVGTAHAE